MDDVEVETELIEEEGPTVGADAEAKMESRRLSPVLILPEEGGEGLVTDWSQLIVVSMEGTDALEVGGCVDAAVEGSGVGCILANSLSSSEGPACEV